MKHAVKLVSAVAFLGLALFSMNADADCRYATGDRLAVIIAVFQIKVQAVGNIFFL